MSEHLDADTHSNKCASKDCENVLTIRNNYVGPLNYKYCIECINSYACEFCMSKYIFMSNDQNKVNTCFDCSWKYYHDTHQNSVLKNVTNLPGKTNARALIHHFKEKFPDINEQSIEEFYHNTNLSNYYTRLCLAEKALLKAYEKCANIDNALAFQLFIEYINTLFELGKTTEALNAFKSRLEENYFVKYITLMDYCGTEYFKKEKYDLEKIGSELVNCPDDLNSTRIKYFLNFKERYTEIENSLQKLEHNSAFNTKIFIDCLRYVNLKDLKEDSLLNAIHLAKSYCPSYVLISSLYVLLSKFYKYYYSSFEKSLNSLEEAAKIWIRANTENEFAVKIFIKLSKAYITIDIIKSKAIILHCMKFADKSNHQEIKVKALKVLRDIFVSNHEYDKVCAAERKLWEIKNSS
ncbi:hypothetical protein SteCoe_1996 [Stentor coeruleus]|uniref:Uncharacterized protein n=1 Tax=Stentor coeruleus TaxID=5963 RepID=A0A1R2D0N6_9CILI|nr:hypothetical protein SteCoe_1996 [Stentor coeruleus]